MKNLKFGALLLLIASTFASCEIVGGIFKAGMGFGIFLVVAVVIFIIWLLNRGKRS